MDPTEVEYEAARAALAEYEERRLAAQEQLKAEAAQVNARYQAAELALEQHRAAQVSPSDAEPQTVEG